MYENVVAIFRFRESEHPHLLPTLQKAFTIIRWIYLKDLKPKLGSLIKVLYY
jgi:hypothetical protein